MTMTQNERLWTIVALVAVAIVFAVTALIAAQRRARLRRAELKERFGPEYDRAVEQLGTRARAERELAHRADRVDHFRFHDLSAADRQLFTDSWRSIQEKFVDEPAVAVTSANELINQVMRARGYPVEHFEQRVADLSVEHPNVIQHYRAAHELSRSVHNGTVDTEQLRQALVHYRMLFADLLQEGAPPVPLDYRRAHAS